MQIVVMAGGLATRMRPLTEEVPKSMLPVGGIPFVGHQLQLFKRGGITEVLLCVGHLRDKIQEYVGDGSRWGLKVSYSWEEGELQGTAGALRDAGTLLADSFLMTWGDSFVRADYPFVMNSHLSSGLLCSVVVFRNENKYDRSNISFDNGKILKYEKGGGSQDLLFVDAGLSVYDRKFIAEIPSGKISMDTIWKKLASENALGGIEVENRFYEIGSMKGLEDFARFVSTGSDVASV